MTDLNNPNTILVGRRTFADRIEYHIRFLFDDGSMIETCVNTWIDAKDTWDDFVKRGYWEVSLPPLFFEIRCLIRPMTQIEDRITL